MEISIMDYIVEQALILIPVLYILGLMLKQSKIKDWLIPWVLLLARIIGAVALIGLNVNSIIQGISATGATVFGNQLIKQNEEKREKQ